MSTKSTNYIPQDAVLFAFGATFIGPPRNRQQSVYENVRIGKLTYRPVCYYIRRIIHFLIFINKKT